MRIERTVAIGAPPEQVWAVLADVPHWPEWTASMREVVPLDDEPLAAGARVRIRQPRLPTVVWTVTELEQGRRFTWEARSTGVHTVASHEVEPDGAGGSRVRLTLDQRGPASGIVRLFFGRRSRRYVEMEAEGLRRRCEGGW